MATTQRQRTELSPRGPQRQRGWLVAAAVFVAVLLIGLGVLALTRNGSGDDVVEPTPSTTAGPTTTTTAARTTTTTAAPTTTEAPPEVDPEALAYAESLVAELNAGDVAAAHARFPSESYEQHDNEGPARSIRSVAGVLTFFEYSRAMESKFELGACATSFGITRCEILRTSPFEAHAPLPQPIRYSVRLDAGVPAFSKFHLLGGEWTAAEYRFTNWLAANHRDEAELLYNAPTSPNPYQNMVDADREAAIKREYVPLWLAADG